MSKLLADNICFGPFCDQLNSIPTGAAGTGRVTGLIGSTIGRLINWVIIVAGLLMLLYLLLGALEWITSSGEKEKLEKAQNKITQAIIGLLVVVVALAIFGLLAGDLLGIVIKNPDGTWSFKIPMLTSP